MNANSTNKEDGNQNSPFVLKLKAIELENKLFIEKQRNVLLQSELESSMSISSKHLDLYKDECITLKQKLTVLENDNYQLRKKELKYQETIKNLYLKKIERVGKEYDSESQKKCERMKKNDNEAKMEEEVDVINVMENEGENTQEFVDLNSDSDDDGMKHSPTLESDLESDDSLVLINSECKTPAKKFKPSSAFIPRDNCISEKDNRAQWGNGYTRSPGNSKSKSPGNRYLGRIPISEQKHRALEKAEQLKRSIKNPSFVRPMNFSHVSGHPRFRLAKKFCMDNHLPDHDTEVVLECEGGATYKVYYNSKKNAFTRAWVNFARTLCLEFGDVLVFELTGSTRFKVHIVKAIQEVFAVP